MKTIACIIMLLWPAVLLAADSATPMLYSRTNIILTRKTLPPQPPVLPWQNEAASENSAALILDVEVRDAMTLYRQGGWYNLSSYSDKSGVLLMFAAPTTEPVVSSAQYAPVDILFIDKEGKINQIVPNVQLSELEQDITPAKPVLAFLFLKGGSCAKLSINPGDEIDYKLFKKPPTVLSTPGQPEAPAKQAAPKNATPVPAAKPSTK